MRTRRGSAFIMALIAVVILTMVLVTAAAETHTVQKTQIHRLDERRAERMAEAALLYALAQMTQIETAVVSLDDDWALIGTDGTQDVIVNGGSFRLQVLDAGSRLNLNSATQEQLELLPLTAEQIDSILDWREADLQPRIEGAKDEYYTALAKPYLTKLRNFDTIDEILMVKGFDANMLYEAQENTTSTALLTAGGQDQQIPLSELLTVDSQSSNFTPLGEPKANVNTASAGQLVQAGLDGPLAQAIVQQRNQIGTFTSWAQLLQVPGITLQNVSLLLDGLTLDTTDSVNGRINLNTASEQTLNLLPGMTPDVSSALVARQGTFQGLGDLASVPGMSLALLGQIAGMVTLSSEAFIVRAIGAYGLSRFAVQAVVVIGENGPMVRKIERYPFFDAAVRWGWADTADTELVLVENNSF
jgi:DNA uptake protein ComE-like DNA-binding protein